MVILNAIAFPNTEYPSLAVLCPVLPPPKGTSQACCSQAFWEELLDLPPLLHPPTCTGPEEEQGSCPGELCLLPFLQERWPEALFVSSAACCYSGLQGVCTLFFGRVAMVLVGSFCAKEFFCAGPCKVTLHGGWGPWPSVRPVGRGGCSGLIQHPK